MMTHQPFSYEDLLHEVPRIVDPMDQFTAVMIVEQQWDLVGEQPSEDRYIEACQYLIDTGIAWQLQGYFGRSCAAMIDAGLCVPAYRSHTTGDYNA